MVVELPVWKLVNHVPEPWQVAIAARDQRRADRPLYPDVRVIPGDPFLSGGIVVAADLVDEVNGFAERTEAVGEPNGNEKLPVVDIVEFEGLPLPERRR